MAPLNVANIGAGPAGCLLARLLHINGIQFTVFEAEASPDSRRIQGGTLDLHAKTGIAALKAAGLYDEFTKLARFDGSSLTICDKRNQPYFRLPALFTNNPEIDRVQLRSLLLQSIPSDRNRGKVQGGFSLVVGADGAWSVVRSGLRDPLPEYSGISGFDMSMPNAQEKALPTYDLLQRGNLFAFSDGKSIIAQQMGDGSIHVSAWGRKNIEWANETRAQLPSLRDTTSEYADWAPELVDMINQTERHIRASSFYMLP
ncbi:hypothetical protein UA08_05523 [Talaromyces atroroseus]|uniref:FAD-binding domain-containing protein n=1 Tax=Talaromyces atroroseus TaxID=1441469 RepID=A0A225AZK7_TALAT|nr:hypothetical protein UA08_05523 [Talaromyces atroroseus]OKL58957.1 hypothetical protein UA08_05523 [Talaromyces atroroseus]